ncbi:MAG: ABC transporter substrate-binding protein [Nitrospira sp.]|nr:ABC transporter substrate-binding protein [Nitrospira sp.]MDH4304305.1 ABC transporter substrate-binding protein [Nitrospira sp.]MDH5195241.1 ABC transporter substrate-binding protein [Nitrospira sp.]
MLSAESRAWEDPLTPDERLGRRIYQQGSTESGPELRVSFAGVDGDLAATLFRCAQCHGIEGQGTEEGGLRVPPLTAAFLRGSHESRQTGRSRVAYTDQTLARAITQGVDAGGKPLHFGMPRYHLNDQQARALVAYLYKIGTDADTDPGVTLTTITIGAALPLSGPLASIGRDAQAVLHGYFRTVNERGGIYGRQIQLVVEDTEKDASPAAATERLIKMGQVFALVGGFESGDPSKTHRLLEHELVPLVGPLALSPQPSDPPNPYVFYTLPGFEIQYRVLLDFLMSQPRLATDQARPRVAIIQPKKTTVLDSILTPTRRKTIDIAIEHEYGRGAVAEGGLVQRMKREHVDAVVFVGDGEDFLGLTQELDRQHLLPMLLVPAGMVGQRVLSIPSRLRSKVVLAAAIHPPTEQDLAELQRLAGQHQVQNFGFSRMAQVAASAFIESLMQVGRHVTRSLVIEKLERFREQETSSGFLLTYGSQRRIGSVRIRLFHVAPDSLSFIPASEWLVPQDPS